MQDSSLKYYILVEGAEKGAAAFKLVGNAAKQAAGAVGATSGAVSGGTKSIKQLGDTTEKTGNQTKRATIAQEGYFYHIAKTTVQSALVNKGFMVMVESMGKAVQQVDLMKNFPASMGALGLSTQDASASLLKLRDYVATIGGDLVEATTSVMRFAEVTKNIKVATAEFVGVKNAIIAGGAGAEVQKNALEQLTQSYSRGKAQLIEWRSMMVAMPAQLNQVAKAMNFPNAQMLGEALTSDKVSMQDFMTELTKLSTGTGPIAKQAIARMQGIQFAVSMFKNAITNGLAAIYQAVGRNNIIAFFDILTGIVKTLAEWTVVLINGLIKLFNFVSGLFGGIQISNITGETGEINSNLDSGADAAGDLGSGLDDAASSAEKLNKSLASFDKMNVLADKTTSGSGKKDDTSAGGAGSLNPADTAALEAIFDNIGGKLREASEGARIFAGIIASFLGIKFAQGLMDQFNGLIKTIKTTSENIDNIKKNIKNLKDDFVDMGKAADNAMEKAGKSIGKSAGTLGNVIASAIGGVIGALSTTVGPAIAGVFTAAAAALGISVGALVAIVVVAIAAIVALVWLIWTNWETIWWAIRTAFSTFWGWMVSLWNTIYDIFVVPLKKLADFIYNLFIFVVAIVAMALELIFKIVVGAITLIYNVLKTIASWVYDNVIKPVVDFFVFLWETIIGVFQAAWNFIYTNILEPVGMWIFSNVISPIINFFKAMWETVSGFVGGFIQSVKNFLSPITTWINDNIITPIAGFFTGLWDGIKSGLSTMMDGLKTLWEGIGEIFKIPINTIIKAINWAIRQMNKVKVPTWVPVIGGKGVNISEISEIGDTAELATGGVVSQPTSAIVGESGAEAIVPLENNTEWIDKLAAKINANGGSGQPIQLTIQIGEERIASKLINLINEKSQMSGRNMILV
jgi:tape measure domain-containing protein